MHNSLLEILRLHFWIFTEYLSLSLLKFANSLLLFAKGLGWLTSLATPGVERQRSSSQASIGSGGAGTGAGGRRMSMEEYDKPNIRGEPMHIVMPGKSFTLVLEARRLADQVPSWPCDLCPIFTVFI